MSDRDKAEIAEMFKSVFNDALEGTKDRDSRPQDIQARVLKDMLPLVNRECPFAIGDLVVQPKERMVYRYPDEGELAMVVANLKPEEHTEYRRMHQDGPHERHDMIILVLAKDNWVKFAVESWRFEPYSGPIDQGA